jgi:hypothetical protein
VPSERRSKDNSRRIARYRATCSRTFRSTSSSGSARHFCETRIALQPPGGGLHATFLTTTQRISTQPIHAFARCWDAAVVMACTASARTPARREPYGYSSLVFGALAPFDSNGCRPTIRDSILSIERSYHREMKAPGIHGSPRLKVWPHIRVSDSPSATRGHQESTHPDELDNHSPLSWIRCATAVRKGATRGRAAWADSIRSSRLIDVLTQLVIGPMATSLARGASALRTNSARR